MNEFNSTQYKFKKTYLEERERATKKVFTKPLDTTRKPKAIDYTLNLNSYKCKIYFLFKIL